MLAQVGTTDEHDAAEDTARAHEQDESELAPVLDAGLIRLSAK
ncbi:hypothetical protein [Kocuria aegyptia]|uniref:Uncharacterized protein n=1 Tax=Kocuria aegyptia TaxID=330943 RepID=A0ABN2L470_9MICC